MSTLPMGWLARNLGRRTALQIGTVSGVLTGLICCVAVLQGSFLLFNIGAIFSGFYASAHQSYRFAATDTASDAFKAKAISWVLRRRHLRRDRRPATRHRHQGSLAALSLRRELHRPVSVCAGRGRRADAAQHPEAAAADGHERRPPALGNRQATAVCRGGGLRGRELFDDEPGDDLGAARHGHVQSFGHRRDARPAMACARHVRAELPDRLADQPVRCRAHHRARASSPDRRRGDRDLPASRSGTSGSVSRSWALAGISPSLARPQW